MTKHKNRLFYKEALKLLSNQDNFLVSFQGYNGLIRSIHGDNLGDISSRVMERLTNDDKICEIGTGSGLLNHEIYYELNRDS